MISTPRPHAADSVPAPTPVEGRGTAGRILDAAEALFAERGFAATAVRDIAERAGVTPASLYNHFAGKQALYDAVLERDLRPFYEILDRAASGDAAAGREILPALMNQLHAAPDLARLIQHEALAGGEHVMRLARRWLAPLYARASAALERSPALGSWEPEELPLLLMTYHHLIFGHFALARALGEVLGVDFLSPDGLARHTRFLEKVTERLLGTGDGQRPAAGAETRSAS
jgi:AcrR family transcriptional regulator